MSLYPPGTRRLLYSGCTCYLEHLFDPAAQDKVENDADRLLANVDFDTMVGTGLSGALVIPDLARRLGKLFAIVRKETERTHSSRPIEGDIGERWLFVDDLIATGMTYCRVRHTVHKYAVGTNLVGAFLYRGNDFETLPAFLPWSP